MSLFNGLHGIFGEKVTAQLGWSGGEGLDEGAGVCGEDCEDVVSLLSGGGDDRPQRGEGLSALDGTESARDFHLHLHHAQRLFGEIVGEWNVEVDQEPQNVVFELVQPKEQVMARPAFDLAPVRAMARQGRQFAMISQAFPQSFKVASVEGCEKIRGERCLAALARLFDRPIGFEEKLAHRRRPGTPGRMQSAP